MLQAKCGAIDRPTIESPRESHCVITVEMGEHIMLHILTLASEGWTVQMAPNPKYGRINGINDRQRTSSKILRAARLNKKPSTKNSSAQIAHVRLWKWQCPACFVSPEVILEIKTPSHLRTQECYFFRLSFSYYIYHFRSAFFPSIAMHNPQLLGVGAGSCLCYLWSVSQLHVVA